MKFDEKEMADIVADAKSYIAAIRNNEPYEQSAIRLSSKVFNMGMRAMTSIKQPQHSA